jgi:hypothetical protein
MTDSTLAATGARTPANVAELVLALPAIARGARWFWFIAGFTAVNAALNLSHSNTNFVVGLAFTLLANAMLAPGAALAIDALLVGFFFLMGLKARQGQAWAFILGVVVYVADALVYVNYQDWMPVGIHALALYYIVTAFLALQSAKKAAGIR